MKVRDVPEASRFEIEVEGEEAGFAQYRRKGDAVEFFHTVIEDEHEGQGLGSRLVRGALDEMRARGERIIPTCPFVRSFVEDHPDYADLVASD